MPSSFKVFYMYFTYFCYDIFGTMVGVPLDGLPALVSPNSDERAKLISVSRVVGSVGDQSALVLFSLFMMFLKLKYTLMSIGIVIGDACPPYS